MVIGSCKVYFRAEWISSLKEKRMVLKSIISKSSRKFNISIAEVECQDSHKNIVIGFVCVTNDRSHANSIIDNVINFLDCNTEAEIVDTVIEIL